MRKQSCRQFEVIVADGGSCDRTVRIAKEYGAKVVVEPACPEFLSRNLGAKEAQKEILLFTCADVLFPDNLLHIVKEKFSEDPTLVALSGPGIPVDSPIVGRLEYELYNRVRYFLSKLPSSIRRFSTSTNFLAVRKSGFEKAGGFRTNDVNADGLMGSRLVKMGKISFDSKAFVYISARRMRKMGFIRFNSHYLYVLENLLPILSNTRFIEKMKWRSGRVHGKMHES